MAGIILMLVLVVTVIYACSQIGSDAEKKKQAAQNPIARVRTQHSQPPVHPEHKPITVPAAEQYPDGIVKQGECGENIRYTLDDSGILRITGTGILGYACMLEHVAGVWEGVGNIWGDDYDYSAWGEEGPDGCRGIRQIIIGEGITDASVDLFRGSGRMWGDAESNGYPDLEEIRLPSSLKNVTSFRSMPSKVRVVVSADNPYYPGKDGVLYDKPETKTVRLYDGSCITQEYAAIYIEGAQPPADVRMHGSDGADVPQV